MADRVWTGVTERPDSPPAMSRVADSGSQYNLRDRIRASLRRVSPTPVWLHPSSCGEPDLAADIVQETFVSFRRGQRPDSVVPWLLTAAMNRCGRTIAACSPARTAGCRPRCRAGGVRLDVVVVEERAKVRQAAVAVVRARPSSPVIDRRRIHVPRDGAATCGVEQSQRIGTLLAPAKRAFREHYVSGRFHTFDRGSIQALIHGELTELR